METNQKLTPKDINEVDKTLKLQKSYLSTKSAPERWKSKGSPLLNTPEKTPSELIDMLSEENEQLQKSYNAVLEENARYKTCLDRYRCFDNKQYPVSGSDEDSLSILKSFNSNLIEGESEIGDTSLLSDNYDIQNEAGQPPFNVLLSECFKLEPNAGLHAENKVSNYPKGLWDGKDDDQEQAGLVSCNRSEVSDSSHTDNNLDRNNIESEEFDSDHTCKAYDGVDHCRPNTKRRDNKKHVYQQLDKCADVFTNFHFLNNDHQKEIVSGSFRPPFQSTPMQPRVPEPPLSGFSENFPISVGEYSNKNNGSMTQLLPRAAANVAEDADFFHSCQEHLLPEDGLQFEKQPSSTSFGQSSNGFHCRCCKKFEFSSDLASHTDESIPLRQPRHLLKSTALSCAENQCHSPKVTSYNFCNNETIPCECKLKSPNLEISTSNNLTASHCSDIPKHSVETQTENLEQLNKNFNWKENAHHYEMSVKPRNVSVQQSSHTYENKKASFTSTSNAVPNSPYKMTFPVNVLYGHEHVVDSCRRKSLPVTVDDKISLCSNNSLIQNTFRVAASEKGSMEKPKTFHSNREKYYKLSKSLAIANALATRVNKHLENVTEHIEQK